MCSARDRFGARCVRRRCARSRRQSVCFGCAAQSVELRGDGTPLADMVALRPATKTSPLNAIRAREGLPCLALGQDRFDEGLLLIGRVSDVLEWMARFEAFLLSGATGSNQDHLTVPSHRPVPPATLRSQVTWRVQLAQPSRGRGRPHRDQVQVGSDYRGVIPFLANHHSGHLHDEWSRRALALCRFLEPRRVCRSRRKEACAAPIRYAIRNHGQA
jgi:hypothetical protein